MFSGIFLIIATSYNLFSEWAYQHYNLAVEVKNSAKVTLLSSIELMFFCMT